MPLASGDRLGPFEIVAPARWARSPARVRLGREVAAKVLLPALAAADDAVGRFWLRRLDAVEAVPPGGTEAAAPDVLLVGRQQDARLSRRRDPLTGHGALWQIDVARGVTSLVTDPATAKTRTIRRGPPTAGASRHAAGERRRGADAGGRRSSAV